MSALIQGQHCSVDLPRGRRLGAYPCASKAELASGTERECLRGVTINSCEVLPGSARRWSTVTQG